jgi:chromosomal replication initiation ATPase DnaA
MINARVIPGLKFKSIKVQRKLSVNVIMKAVCLHYETDIVALRQVSRKSRTVQARYILFYLLRKHTDMSLVDVVSYFVPAIKDHSTIIHGVRYIEGQLNAKHDNSIKNIMNEIYI